MATHLAIAARHERQSGAQSGTPLATLLDQGFCVIPKVIDSGVVAGLAAELDPVFAATPAAKGPFYGTTTKRFHGLLARSRRVQDFVVHSEVLDLVEHILGPACDRIQLNLTQAIEILPGGKAQPPHRDQDMWPIRNAGVEYLVNVMWPFTSYTADNGATLVWPGSHRRQNEILLDPADAVPVAMAPGDALLFLGSTLHAGGANRTRRSRRGMIVSYSLGWLKPYELPWLAYPPEVARTFPDAVRALAGYAAHRPNLGTYEGHCPSLLLDAPDAVRGAIDILRPEQEALIAEYYAGSLGFAPPGADGAR